MKDDRTGDWLWHEWSGYGWDSDDASVIYVTFGDVDMELDLVRRALASCLQRDGVVSSLGDGFLALEQARIIHGFSGSVEEDPLLTVCDEDGYTRLGDEVDDVVVTTWVLLNT